MMPFEELPAVKRFRAAIAARPDEQPSQEGMVERTASGESWNGIQIVAYHWLEPSGFNPPSSTEIDRVVFHWSTGPDHAEPLVRLRDVRAALAALPSLAAERGVPYRERLENEERILAAEMEAERLKRVIRSVPIPGHTEEPATFSKRMDRWLNDNDAAIRSLNKGDA